MHMLSVERRHNFTSATPIDVQLNDAAYRMRARKEEERIENRHIGETIFDIVRHLAKQNTTFPGHDESAESKNNGNFLEELEFVSKYHAPLTKWMDTHPQNVTYFSHMSQNEMIGILSNLIIEIICNEAKGITSEKIDLHAFSDTEWSARSDNLEVVLNVYPVLLSMFKEYSEQLVGLLVRLRQFRFVAACLILKKCFSLSQYASEYLQNKGMDLTSGVAAIRDLRAMMESFRSDKEFDTFLAEATSFAEKRGGQILDTSFTDPKSAALQSKRRRTVPARVTDGQTILETSSVPCNRPDGESDLECFRRELYFPFLDKMLSELDKRFSDQACETMSHAAILHPRNLFSANVSKIEAIAKFYKLYSNRAGQQFLLFSQSQQCCEWKSEYDKYQKDVKERKDKRKPWMCLPSLLDIFSKNDLHNLYADLFRVITIVAAMPVTVASCERTHSKDKIINNYLRAAMSPDRLEDLVQISSEREIAVNIALSKLEDVLKLANHRKLLL
eukprot:gene16053-7398_t